MVLIFLKIDKIRSELEFFALFLFCSTSWGSQPYTGGSYTAIGTGGTQADIETIAQPLFSNKKKRVVRFL